MPGPLHIGHSVRLLAVIEIARSLEVGESEMYKLLARLDIPVGDEYGPEPVINLPAFEAAVYADLAPDMPPDITRLYQAIAALDHVVLDKTALRKRLAAYLRYLTRSSKGGRVRGG